MKYNPFLFTGRIRRLHYLLIVVALNVLGYFAGEIEGEGFGVLTLLSLLALWPSITLYVQRAHDSGRDGWVALWSGLLVVVGIGGVSTLSIEPDPGTEFMIIAGIGAIALIWGAIWSLVITFAPGEPDSNQFGSNPRASAA